MSRLLFPVFVVTVVYLLLQHLGQERVVECERRGGEWVAALQFCRGIDGKPDASIAVGTSSTSTSAAGPVPVTPRRSRPRPSSSAGAPGR